MGATGESVRRVTDFGFNPAWSPDGGRHFFLLNLSADGTQAFVEQDTVDSAIWLLRFE